MDDQTQATQIADLFKSVSQPARVEILLAIGNGEACVCHLEAKLKMRQAYISQHLMALRQAGILDARREGRFVFYRLENLEMMGFIRMAAQLAGIESKNLNFAAEKRPHVRCCCPKCAPLPQERIIELKLSEAGNQAT